MSTPGSVAPQDHSVPLASIREFATGIRGDAAWGTLSEDLLAIDGRHDGDGLGARRLIVRDVSDRILEAIDRPTMLVFQDLHWTDEMSLEVIGELARHLSELPLIVVADYRGDEFPIDSIHREWRARLLSQRFAEEVRLRPFTRDETGLATTLILGGELPASREVVEAVHERTNGIPLHIEELLAALDDEARTDGRRIRDVHVPDTIADTVLARLARLSPDARTLARAGAVLGRCFSPDVIAGMVDRPLEEVEPAIEELIDAAFIFPFDYVDQGYYDFRHQLLRDAIYDSVPTSQKRRFHAQAAEFVMALEAASVIHASRHYEQAGLKAAGVSGGVDRRRGGEPDLRPPGGVRALRACHREHAGRLADRRTGRPLLQVLARRAPRSSATWSAPGRLSVRASSICEAGRPIEAAEMLTLISVDAIRGRPADRGVRPVDDPGDRRGGGRPAIAGTRPDAWRSSAAATPMSCCLLRNAWQRARRRSRPERSRRGSTIARRCWSATSSSPGSTSSTAGTRPGSRTG